MIGDLRDEEAEAEVARQYRRKAAMMRAEAAERRATSAADAHALEERAADLVVLAASIERKLRGLPGLPPAAIGR